MKPTVAPDFPSGLEWLNTDRPLRVHDLAGRIVLLSFATFACSNCMRLVPEIRRLKEEHPELTVIEVHSPGFEFGTAAENPREAVRFAGIDHPVVIDRDRLLWQAFGVRNWPTFVLIDPGGSIVGMTTGEGLYGRLNRKLNLMAQNFEQRGLLEKSPLQSEAKQERKQIGALFLPGKITADNVGMRLFISDTGHHRIVIADRDGKILETIGSGTPGNLDGSFNDASFYQPAGLVFDEEANTLYVADTGNHTIRQISWPDRKVVTIAGTGLCGLSPGEGGAGTMTALNAPRDLALMGGYLYIAMAGARQIWRLDTATHEIEPYAGSGQDGLVDGPLDKAAFVEPSGIVTDGEVLYVADSGASAIRRIKRGMAETFIGRSPDDFGDLDTIARMARIHHSKGIAYHEGLIYLADTCNHKIKEFDPATGWVLTRVGSGSRGYQDGLSGDARLDEPDGLVNFSGLWYITDTGNNIIRVYDPVRHVVSTLRLWG